MIDIDDLTDRQFGQLTVLSFAGKNTHGHKTWLCGCSCGNKLIVSAPNLFGLKKKSCGCASTRNQKLDETKVLAALRRDGDPAPGMTSTQLAVQVGCASLSSMIRVLHEMKSRGLVIPVSDRHRPRLNYWFLDAAGREQVDTSNSQVAIKKGKLKVFDELMEYIVDYYEARNLKWPDAKESALWITTEVGELIDSLLRKEQGWVRNNAKSSDPAEELADTLMMVMVCARSLGVDVVEVLLAKMERKISESARPN